MASLKNSLRVPQRFVRPVKNTTSEEIVNPTIYNVMDNSRTLSEQKIISSTASNAGPLEDSLAILSAFGMTVVEETDDIQTSILTNKFLDNSKLEKIQKTQDSNPNRLQIKKFEKLKPKKVSANEIFNQTTNNTINELDDCQPNEMKAEKSPPSNVIELTNSFINFSPIPLATRIKIR